MKSFEQELRDELAILDEKAEAQGANGVRQKIATVLEDIREPAGKENARMAIFELREELDQLGKGRKSHKRVSSVQPTIEGQTMEMDMDDMDDAVA